MKIRAALLLLLVPVSALAAPVTSREEIVSRAEAFVALVLSLPDPPNRHECLLREEYEMSNCDGGQCTGGPDDERKSSDLYWHPEFLNCSEDGLVWKGTPYALGSGFQDGHEVSAADFQPGLDDGAGAGNHSCHYSGNGCQYPGCSWSVGTDCSGLVCSALGIQYFGTSELDHGAGADKVTPVTCFCEGSFLNWPGSPGHTVLVRSFDGEFVDVVEAVDRWPVSWVNRYPESFFDDYIPMDSKAVAECQASDGTLFAELIPGGSVRLTWEVEYARNAGRYQYQYYEEAGDAWRTIEEVDALDGGGPHTYESLYSPQIAGDGADLIFRVREIEVTGNRIPYGETKAFPSEGGS